MPQSEQVNFRASPDFLAKLTGAAEKVGERKSDYIRQAGSSWTHSEPIEDSPFDLATTLMMAARGDIDAQRAMANRAYEHFLAAAVKDDNMAAIALTECLTYAPLAALHGAAGDCETLVSVLARFGEWQAERGRKDIGRRLDATGLLLADAMADDGQEAMAQMVSSCRGLPADTVEEARRPRRSLCECGSRQSRPRDLPRLLRSAGAGWRPVGWFEQSAGRHATGSAGVRDRGAVMRAIIPSSLLSLGVAVPDEPNDNGRKTDGTFASGNKPGGRKAGSRNTATLAVEALLEGEAEGLTRKAIEMALGVTDRRCAYASTGLLRRAKTRRSTSTCRRSSPLPMLSLLRRHFSMLSPSVRSPPTRPGASWRY